MSVVGVDGKEVGFNLKRVSVKIYNRSNHLEYERMRN